MWGLLWVMVSLTLRVERSGATQYWDAMYTVAALYHFTSFDDPTAIKGPLAAVCAAGEVMGTLLLAREGINGTIAGPRDGIDAVLSHIRGLPGCADFEWKESHASVPPFNRMKVRIKREIVTMGQPDVDPTASVGNYVAPEDWNELIASPDVAVIDTRNDYEVAIGTTRNGSTTSELRCSAPVESAVKSRPTFFWDRVLRMCIT